MTPGNLRNSCDVYSVFKVLTPLFKVITSVDMFTIHLRSKTEASTFLVFFQINLKQNKFFIPGGSLPAVFSGVSGRRRISSAEP